jgi:Tol biopolymer transport system component
MRSDSAHPLDASLELPPPPPAIRRRRPLASVMGLRAALVVSIAFVSSAAFAYRSLSPYAPVTAKWLLPLVVVPPAALGYVIGWRWPMAVRLAGLMGLAALAAVVPWASVRWVPGIAQPTEYPIPGAPTIVASAAPDGNWDLYLVPNGDARDRVALTNTSVDQERFPQLSPDDSRLVYATLQMDGTYDLYLMHLKGRRPGSVERLLAGPGSLTDTSWSPDGTRLLVRSDVDERGARIYLLDLATRELEPFVRNASNPTWSPDGTQVAYVSYRHDEPGNADIFVAESDGTHPRAIIDTGSDDYYPVWSPDGQQISFTSRVHDGDEDVFIADLRGHHIHNLTPDWWGSDETYGWTSSGRILFLSDRSRTGGTFLYFMDTDGSDVRLTEIL